MREPPESLMLAGEFKVRGRVAKVPMWTVSAAGKLPPNPEGNVEGGSYVAPLTP
ncbi:MAG TPA: hypothetical protein VIJ39_04290 [Solirubrobacteraceae bacterium]